jgi:hypothetical protein
MDTELSREPPISKRLSAGPAAAGVLQAAIARFPSQRGPAIHAVQHLQSSDPAGLAHAAIQILSEAEEKSPGLKNAVSLLTASNLLADLLLNRHILSLALATSLARKAKSIQPLLDVHLFRQVAASAAGKVIAIKDAEALHALELVGAISDCSCLGSYLIQFLNHPNDKVRSKAALMLGRSNWNLARLEGLLASDDNRMRANAVESLWGHRHADVQKILWKATQDRSTRVVINALLGLCKAGDRAAYTRLVELATTSDPALRSGAAWAMGESGAVEFEAALNALTEDDDPKVRAMAEKSRKKLPPVPSPPVQGPTKPPPIESTTPSHGPRPGWLSGNHARD